MKRLIGASLAVLVLAGSTAVYAQHRSDHGFRPRISAEDRSAFTDARIAAVKAGLRLTAEQEKLWPPVEAAVRDFAKLRVDRANARQDRGPMEDPVAMLRERADRLAANASALKRIAETADPLYKTLDDGQKRRLRVLTRMGGRFAGRPWHRGGHEGRPHGGPDSGYGQRGERGATPGPERL